MIGIFTIKGDLHALVIQKTLKEKGITSHIIEVDRLWDSNSININFNSSEFYLLDREKKKVCIDKLRLIWWRRSVRGQQYENSHFPEQYKGYMNNEFEASLFGLLHSKFTGKWISHPFNTTLASNKIVQTQSALRAGLTLPKTLFSQDYKSISEFVSKNPDDVIIKPVYGSTTTPVYTKRINKSILKETEGLTICPTIFQEYIPGNTHLRINVFGNNIYSFIIQTEELDWRQNITNPVFYGETSPDLQKKIIDLLRIMNLRMGIFDFKVHKLTGETYFFEVNPQGNFLFLDGLTKFPLAEKFADYLISECL